MTTVKREDIPALNALFEYSQQLSSEEIKTLANVARGMLIARTIGVEESRKGA